MVARVCRDGSFSCKFAPSILRERGHGIPFKIALRGGLGAVKDIVGGDMDQPAAMLLQISCQIFWASGVDEPGVVLGLFAGVDSRECGAVNQDFGLVSGKKVSHLFFVADVEFFGATGDDLVGPGQEGGEIPAQLSLGTADEYLHENACPDSLSLTISMRYWPYWFLSMSLASVCIWSLLI